MITATESPDRAGQAGRLEGTVALVTGGGRGIGRTVAETLARAGAAVAVMGRSAEPLAETVSHIERSGGRAGFWIADVTEREQVEESVAAVETALGPIGLLVNNAGRAGSGGSLWRTDPDEWWRDVEVNLRGPFLCSRAVLAGMVERGAGRIVNLGSNVGIRPAPKASAYAASKAALLRLSDSLAADLWQRGVRVFAISPGWVWTDMTRRTIERTKANQPDVPVISDDDVFPPARAGELIVRLAAGEADLLSGRYLHVADDLDALLAEAEAIVADDRYALRLVR